jgi:hypothetical protein
MHIKGIIIIMNYSIVIERESELQLRKYLKICLQDKILICNYLYYSSLNKINFTYKIL